jgi:hypothetical protein
MARLGHANPAAARRYQHTATDRDRLIAAGLDAIIQALPTDARAINAR